MVVRPLYCLSSTQAVGVERDAVTFVQRWYVQAAGGGVCWMDTLDSGCTGYCSGGSVQGSRTRDNARPLRLKKRLLVVPVVASVDRTRPLARAWAREMDFIQQVCCSLV